MLPQVLRRLGDGPHEEPAVSQWIPRITVHSLAVLVSLLTYVLTTRIEQERRPPSIAIAWVLGLIALPYVALPMYLVFGRRKVKRRIGIPLGGVPGRQALGRAPHRELRAAARDGLNRAHASDGAEARSALYETMAAARTRLDMCTFILGDDVIRRRGDAAMIECRQRGVAVRFLIDGVGSAQLPARIFGAARRRRRDHRLQPAAGAQDAGSAQLAQPPQMGRGRRRGPLGRRSQPGRRVFLPGAGVSAWNDLSFDLRGAGGGRGVPSIRGGLGGRRRQARAAGIECPPPSAPAAGRAQFLPSGPDQVEDTVHALLVDACYHASERILAATPYFVPDSNSGGGSAPRRAARREDRSVHSPKSNHRLADFARNRSLRALGVRACPFTSCRP